MNSLLDDDEQDRNDRELTLSTGTILGIFFGLVLICGLFFGFGYRMGSHKSPQPVESATVENSPAPAANFSSFKPAAGSPAGGAANAAKNVDQNPVEPPSTANNSATTEAAPVVRVNPTTDAPPVAIGSFVVQVAAVSHQEDAELLVNALRTKGYPVSAHTVPQDQFFHIQVGPFNNLKDAQAAKQRLLADGYQPIIK
jgi:DedD protein